MIRSVAEAKAEFKLVERERRFLDGLQDRLVHALELLQQEEQELLVSLGESALPPPPLPQPLAPTSEGGQSDSETAAHPDATHGEGACPSTPKLSDLLVMDSSLGVPFFSDDAAESEDEDDDVPTAKRQKVSSSLPIRAAALI